MMVFQPGAGHGYGYGYLKIIHIRSFVFKVQQEKQNGI